MSLLSLPAELVRQILHTLDPDSFYICLQTTKMFREHALASSKLLLDQLSRMPGQRVIPAHISGDPEALLRLFGKTATQHLMNGASQMADMYLWKSLPCMDRKISSIIKWDRTKDSEQEGPR